MTVVSSVAFAGLIVLTCCPTVPASEDVSRPRLQSLFLLDTAYPQDRGEFQLSVVGLHFRETGGRESAISVELEYGLTERLQLSASLPWRWVSQDGESKDGAGDVEFGVLLEVTPANHTVTLSFGLDLRLPTGRTSTDIGEGVVAIEPKLLLAWDLDDLILHAHIGADLSRAQRSLVYGVAIERPYEQFSLIAEVSAETADHGTEIYLTPGIAWRPEPSVELGLGAAIGLTGKAAEWGILARATFEF